MTLHPFSRNPQKDIERWNAHVKDSKKNRSMKDAVGLYGDYSRGASSKGTSSIDASFKKNTSSEGASGNHSYKSPSPDDQTTCITLGAYIAINEFLS